MITLDGSATLATVFQIDSICSAFGEISFHRMWPWEAVLWRYLIDRLFDWKRNTVSRIARFNGINPFGLCR